MKKENTMVNEAVEVNEVMPENQEAVETEVKKGFFTKVGEAMDKGVKKAAPVAKKVGKGAILIGAGAVAAIAGAKAFGSKSQATDIEEYEPEAEEYDTKYALEDEYTE